MCVGFVSGPRCSSYPFYFEIISQFHGYILLGIFEVYPHLDLKVK